MATKLESLSTKLQSALDLANSLPDAITLDELANPGSASTMLAGTEMLDAEGKKVTGSIETKSSDDLSVKKSMLRASVAVPAGYYAEDASISMEAISVPDPSIVVDLDGCVASSYLFSEGGYVGNASEGYTTYQLPTQYAKTITPTKSTQTAVAAGKYTTGAVTVGAIPDEYQDVSGVTATGFNVESGKVIVTSNGSQQTGILKTNKVVLDTNPSVYIAGGSGGTSAELAITGKSSDGELVADFDALGNVDPSKVLAGSTFSSGGYLNTTGTMPNNGSMSKTIDGLNTKSATIPAGYTSGGTVSLDSTIDDTADSQAAQIAEIMGLLDGKSVPGGGGASIDTCSIRLINNDRSINGYSYLSYRDGQFVPVTYNNYLQHNNIDVTLTDVICGGYIYVQTRRLDGMTGIEIAGEATTERTLILGTAYATVNIYAPSIAGSSSTVTIIGKD